jgi:translation initiation factor IF-3
MIMVLGPTKKKAEAKAEERRRRSAADEPSTTADAGHAESTDHATDQADSPAPAEA